MPDEIYEIIALAARYWFLLLMLLIAWRSYRWYTRDRKKHKRRLKLLPDAGYIGELVVVRGDAVVSKGTCIPVSREGILGYLRSNDVCVPVDGIANRHLWFMFDDVDGLRVEPLRGRRVVADGLELTGKRGVADMLRPGSRLRRAFLYHGSVLRVGEAVMRLRMFSGFEYAGEIAARQPADEADDQGLAADLEEREYSDPVRRMHEIAEWQALQDEEDAEEQEFYPPEMDGEDDGILPPMNEEDLGYYEATDDSSVFYPPVMDDEEDADAPESLYLDEDEAARAKRVLWDKLFKGGKRR